MGAHGFTLDEVELLHDCTMLGPSVLQFLVCKRCVCTLWLLIVLNRTQLLQEGSVIDVLDPGIIGIIAQG